MLDCFGTYMIEVLDKSKSTLFIQAENCLLGDDDVINLATITQLINVELRTKTGPDVFGLTNIRLLTSNLCFRFHAF